MFGHRRIRAIAATAALAFLLSAAVRAQETAGRRYLLYVLKPITNKRILPDSRSIPGELSDSVSLVAAAGEYEPANFVVRATEDIAGLHATATDLKTDRGESIPASNVDIRVVKCWYQDEGKGSSRWSAPEGYLERVPAQTYNPTHLTRVRVLVPELLLRDDSLIKVDTAAKQNYLKTTRNGAVDYLLISSEKKGEGVAGSPAIPVGDSPVLLPVDVAKDTNKQFWITVKVPESAAPGVYHGEIKLAAEDGPLGALKLNVNVLPFKLAEPYYISSIYYYGPSAQFYGDKVGEQFRREMANMYAHGVTNPIVPRPVEKLGDFLKIRTEAGMKGKTIFYEGICTGNPTDPAKLAELKERVKKAIEIAKSHGVEEVYVYGKDEALCHGTEEEAIRNFTSQRAAWEAVHEVGGKVFVAGSPVGLLSGKRAAGNFGLMGDIQDLFVCVYYPSREEARRWHSKGHKITCYGNPQGGIEQPELYRRNYGLLLWQNEYDGAMTYIYHWEWGDFYRKTYKQHNMVYPTIDGVIDTIQWEGYREGVDDVRYLTTLLQAIQKAEQSADEAAKTAVAAAKDYLSSLKEVDINKSGKDLDVVRAEMIEHILRLTGKK